MHDELIAEIEDWRPDLQGLVDRTTPLVSSGKLDSLGLMRLLLWIEGKVGRSVRVTDIDLLKEWDDVDSIVGFVERERG